MKEQPKYNVGDVVQLKSGGPAMTVQKIIYGSVVMNEDPDTIMAYSCQWFAGKKAEKYAFPGESLVAFVAKTNTTQVIP